MKFKFVSKWSGMVLYVNDSRTWDDDGRLRKQSWWRKATDTEAYQVMCLINQHTKDLED